MADEPTWIRDLRQWRNLSVANRSDWMIAHAEEVLRLLPSRMVADQDRARKLVERWYSGSKPHVTAAELANAISELLENVERLREVARTYYEAVHVWLATESGFPGELAAIAERRDNAGYALKTVLAQFDQQRAPQDVRVPHRGEGTGGTG